MKIKEYIENYTSGNRIEFKQVLAEANEFLYEVFRLNKHGLEEEFRDIFHFLQLWLYWRFGINGEIWGITKKSVDKFMNRKKVWEEIYEFVGLSKDISGFCGNYNKLDKTIRHLSQFGISAEIAEKAYNKVVLKKKTGSNSV